MNTKSLEDQYEQWLKEEAENQRIDAENAAKINARNAEWMRHWPHYCKHCHGWGAFTGYQSVPYGSTTASFEVSDPCEALPVDTCHRCGEHGLREDGEGPCLKCGWNFDDGLNQ